MKAPATHQASNELSLPSSQRLHKIATQHGRNRNEEANQLDANDDIEAVKAFFKAKSRKSEATKRQYRKEISRFVAWLAIERQLSISGVTADALNAYEAFLSNPQPASMWISSQGKPNPDNTGWRPPFKGPLSPASISLSLTVVRSMFSFMANAGYLRGNPFVAFGDISQVAQDEHGRLYTVDSKAPIERTIADDDKHTILAGIEAMPRETKAELFRYHRIRWVLNLLLLTGLRRNEAADAFMGDVVKRREGYFLNVIGKGRKRRQVPMPDALIDELKVYRASLGLSEMPMLGEETALVQPVRKTGGNLTGQEIYRAVKSGIDEAIKALSATIGEDQASALRKISTHWLRHTYGHDLVAGGADLVITQDNLGHNDLNTTRRYVTDNRKRQMEATQKAFQRNTPELE